MVVDVSDPFMSIILGAVDTPGRAQRVCVAESFAYVSSWDDGLAIVDVSTPAEPAMRGHARTRYGAGDVEVEESYGYLTTHRSGLQVVDISNPDSPLNSGSVACCSWGAGRASFLPVSYMSLAVLAAWSW